jgi:membrane protein DedA with SNARE-associated domain
MDDLISRTTDLIVAYGFWAGPLVGLLAFGESLAIVGVLIPGTAILLSVGGLMGAGLVDPVTVVLWALLGALAGNWASYVIGRKIGPRAYRTWPLNRDRRSVARARLFFRRYGFAAVFLSRFLGPMRAVVPLVAGVMEMSGRRFQAANLLSAAIWVPAIFAPGYLAAARLGAEAQVSELDLLAFAAGITAITLVGAWLGAKVLQPGSRRSPKKRDRN